MARSLSLQIPKENNYLHQPTLQEILSNAAPSPWTLGAFMAYLSENHCLETLEFTMDAARYEKHYHAMLADDSKISNLLSNPTSPDKEFVRNLWQKLLDAYIRPNAPREVNLPCEVRNHLLSLPYSMTCPDPSELVSAIKITYELMDQSVLIPFLNSTIPLREPDPSSNLWSSSESSSYSQFSGEETLSPPGSSHNSQHRMYGNTQLIITESSPRIANNCFRTGCRFSSFIFGSSPSVPSSSTSNGTHFSFASDESSSIEPITPPGTPPTIRSASDLFHHTSRIDTNSMFSATSSSWKKMGAKFHRKKTRSTSTNSIK